MTRGVAPVSDRGARRNIPVNLAYREIYDTNSH